MTTAYLDTCIVSGLVKNDIPRDELRVLCNLLQQYERGGVKFVCSDVVQSELDRIPLDYKGPHIEKLKLFRSMPRVSVGGLTRPSLMGTPSANPRHLLWRRLTRILKERDAQHVFVASGNRIKYLITVDRRSMLSHADEVLQASGVQLVRPSEFLQVIAGT